MGLVLSAATLVRVRVGVRGRVGRASVERGDLIDQGYTYYGYTLSTRASGCDVTRRKAPRKKKRQTGTW